jgi:hypothetical protein
MSACMTFYQIIPKGLNFIDLLPKILIVIK